MTSPRSRSWRRWASEIALVDVGLFTLPARMVPDVLLGRVFGIFESLISLTVAVGSLAAPLAVHAFGIRGALAVVGLLCPLCVLAAWPRLQRIDRAIIVRDDEIALLRGVGMLRALPLPAIERLAAGVKRAVVSAGTTVFDEGADGDAFYVIASGEAEVHKDGRPLRVLSRGDGFGEIACYVGALVPPPCEPEATCTSTRSYATTLR